MAQHLYRGPGLTETKGFRMRGVVDIGASFEIKPLAKIESALGDSTAEKDWGSGSSLQILDKILSCMCSRLKRGCRISALNTRILDARSLGKRDLSEGSSGRSGVGIARFAGRQNSEPSKS